MSQPAKPAPRRVVLIAIPDLMLVTRVAEAARAAGIELVTATAAQLAERGRERVPDQILIDLAAAGDPAAAIAAVRAEPALAGVRVIGFYPHVQDELRVAALAAGATHALPRSAFLTRLAEVLAGAFPAPR